MKETIEMVEEEENELELRVSKLEKMIENLFYVLEEYMNDND